MSTYKIYKYRLYPNRQQQNTLDEMLEIARHLYNYAIHYRRKRWKESRYSVTYFEQATMWRDWRNECPEDNPLRLLNMSAGQQLLRRLDKAYKAFLKGDRGLPRYKSKQHFHSLEFRYGDGCKLKIEHKTIFYIQNIGEVKVKLHRSLPNGAKIPHVVLKCSRGKWYVCFSVEIADSSVQIHSGPHIGIDMGLSALITLSNGNKVENPRWARQKAVKMRVIQRRLNRRKKGSSRWKKDALIASKLHEQIANTRRDFWHKVTHDITASYSLVVIEDLNLEFMTRNKNLAFSANDASLGLFRQLLIQKASYTGCRIVIVNAYNTSQICSNCEIIVPKDLSMRVHYCPHCGLVIDRDHNAAINILKLAFTMAGALPLGAKVDQ